MWVKKWKDIFEQLNQLKINSLVGSGFCLIIIELFYLYKYNASTYKSHVMIFLK